MRIFQGLPTKYSGSRASRKIQGLLGGAAVSRRKPDLTDGVSISNVIIISVYDQTAFVKSTYKQKAMKASAQAIYAAHSERKVRIKSEFSKGRSRIL